MDDVIWRSEIISPLLGFFYCATVMVKDFTAVLVWLLLLLFSTFGFCL